MKRFLSALTLAVACFVTTGCADAPLELSSIQMGRSLNPDATVGSHTTGFKPDDTVYVSVLTTAAGSGEIGAKWTYSGQVIGEPTKKVSLKGSGATEFHIQNSGGFPPGSYGVELFIDGVSVGERAFMVNKQ